MQCPLFVHQSSMSCQQFTSINISSNHFAISLSVCLITPECPHLIVEPVNGNTTGPCADPEGGPTLKNHKNTGFLSNTGLDPLKNHKATKPEFNFGPPSACQGNAIQMVFHWRANDGPLLMVLGSPLLIN